MRKLLVILLLVLGSFNVSNSDSYISNIQSKELYYYNYKVLSNFTYLENKFSKVFYNTDQLNNIPISLPVTPEKNIYISSEYGKRQIHPILKIPSYHKGIDIAAKKGTPVLSTADGVIIKSSHEYMGYGKYIKIQHANNVTTTYAHLHKRNVEYGDTVKVGEIIGEVGNTGLSTGNHLHYEIRKRNIPIDPFSVYLFCKISEYNDLYQINNFIKNVQMKTKEITKSYTLEELKNLKDELVQKINTREYNLKHNKVKKVETVENSVATIELEKENLIRVKEMLAKANTIELEEKSEKSSNNSNIFRLALLRDLKSTLIKVSNANTSTKENSSISIKDFADAKIKELTSEISEIDSKIKEFNSNTKINITLISKE